MKQKNLLFGTFILYILFILIYLFFIFFEIDHIILNSILIISSVAVLPSITLYTIIESKKEPDNIILKKKISLNRKPYKEISSDFLNDYFEAMPLIDDYADSEDSYEEIPKIHEFIFSSFIPEELEKIELLDLSKMDKIFFLRELLYYDAEERKVLIESMLEAKNNKKIIYYPPKNKIGTQDRLRVYVRSLVEPGEKTKILIIESSDFIRDLKERIAVFFGYNLDDFLLSSGGILLHENSLIREYNIDDDDEIALIPRNKK